MSTTPRRRTGGRSARVTQAVHAATLAALTEHGLDGLAIEDIAARAGVNKTTIYRRWGNRQKLLADAVVSNSARQIEIPDTGSLRDDLVTLALRVRDALVAPMSRALMAALAGGRHHEELESLGRLFWAARLGAARPLVERAVRRREISATVDPDDLILRIVGPIWLSVLGPGRPVPDTFVEQTVDIVLAGTAHRSFGA
jgi:AcrR family transcriptional regulator